MTTSQLISDDINAKLVDIRSALDALYFMIVGIHGLDVIESREKNAFTFIICKAADNIDCIIKASKMK